MFPKYFVWDASCSLVLVSIVVVSAQIAHKQGEFLPLGCLVAVVLDIRGGR